MTNEIDSTIDLPTVAEIEASTDILSIRTNTIKVVRVKERFAVKIAHGIPPQEAENMKFVAANSKVSVPKVYANFVDLETTKRYIIMDFVPGSDLQKLLPSLTPAEKKKVSERIKEQIDELRSIPPPDYLGNLNAMPYTEGVLSSPDGTYNPVICGPFQDQEQMNRGILERLALSESPHYIRLLRGMVDATLQNHRTVFTHGDLQPKNVLVERREISDDRGADFKVTLLDWNLSGWYPKFWDFCNSTLYSRFKLDWLELVPDIFEQYPLEYLMMQVVYSSVFY